MAQGFHVHNISMPPAPKENIMGHEPSRWSQLHRLKGRHTNDSYQLKKEADKLI